MRGLTVDLLKLAIQTFAFTTLTHCLNIPIADWSNPRHGTMTCTPILSPMLQYEDGNALIYVYKQYDASL